MSISSKDNTIKSSKFNPTKKQIDNGTESRFFCVHKTQCCGYDTNVLKTQTNTDTLRSLPSFQSSYITDEVSANKTKV